ncbi:uncharacterized protein LOC123699310 [Colias croceus]|uniref:uncharacterized protein LOC123699310 n=1 Tax=Colias crocea TaxID=72248 RepID=UPI001E27FBCB|nr:uncharacterized protein LOC123699310 [Colias croceus]
MKWINCVVLLCVFIIKCKSMSESEIEDFENFLKETSQLDQNLKSNPEADFDEDEPASDNAWEESGKFEGDLILNDRQRRMIVTNVVEGLARNGLADSTKRWPNNEVIYFIQREHFNLDQVQAIEDGIADLAQASCVKFTPYKKGDRDAVVIQGSRRGCFSQVGYQGGYQVLNLSGRHPVGRGCFRHGTVVHELLHTLGFYHMQSSPDRDDFIDVLWENIIQTTRHNFRKYNSFAVSDFGVGYDYESVLHYSRKAFSVNGKDTLVPKQRGAEIGQRIGLSQKDTQKLNKMYCDADSDKFLDSDTSKPPPAAKKPNKNKPFEGRGIGYHQGKAVAIKLPAAQTYNLHDFSNIDKFNDFSKTKESVPPMPVHGFGVVKEINNLYAVPQYTDNEENSPSGMLVVRGNRDENEYIDDVYKFSGEIRNNMDPSDARKLDYGRSTVPSNPHEYVIPGSMQYHDVYQPYTVKHLNNGREAFPKNFLQKSQEGTEYTDKQKEDYVNDYHIMDRNLIQHMKQKYNENRYQHDQENIHALQSPRSKSPYFDNTEKIKNYNDNNYSYGYNGGYDPYDNVAVSPNLNILHNSKESELPSQTKWLNSNTKLYHPYDKEIHFDDR